MLTFLREVLTVSFARELLYDAYLRVTPRGIRERLRRRPDPASWKLIGEVLGRDGCALPRNAWLFRSEREAFWAGLTTGQRERTEQLDKQIAAVRESLESGLAEVTERLNGAGIHLDRADEH